MDSAQVEAIARELFTANRAREIYRPLPETITAQGLDAAYDVQAAYNRLQVADGVGHPVGYKIALTSAAMQQFVGVAHPLAGVVYESRVHVSPVELSLAAYQHIGVEFEVTVRLGDALEKRDAPHDRQSVAAAVATCAASYELVEDRNADFDQVNAFNLIAENNWNAGLILGQEVENWAAVDLENGPTRLWIDGQLAGEGKTGDALGHPLDAVAWLANLLNDRGKALQAGMVVMTGSSITTRFPEAGQHYRFAVEGLGEVAIDWRA